MASNHQVPEIDALYKGYRIETIPVRRAINCRAENRNGIEVIIRNY